MVSVLAEYRLAPPIFDTLNKPFGFLAAARTKPVRSYEISRCRKLLAFPGVGTCCNVAFSLNFDVDWLLRSRTTKNRNERRNQFASFERDRARFTWK